MRQEAGEAILVTNVPGLWKMTIFPRVYVASSHLPGQSGPSKFKSVFQNEGPGAFKFKRVTAGGGALEARETDKWQVSITIEVYIAFPHTPTHQHAGSCP